MCLFVPTHSYMHTHCNIQWPMQFNVVALPEHQTCILTFFLKQASSNFIKFCTRKAIFVEENS